MVHLESMMRTEIMLVMYDQSGYFTLRAHRLSNLTTYQPPQDGTVLEYIRGVINTQS